MTLHEIVHAHLPTLTHGHTFRDAADRMDLYQFPALVVLDQDRRVTHVVTEGDLCRAATARGDVTSLAREPVIIYATADPFTAEASTEVSEALHVMLSRGLTILPVIEEAVFLGVVFRCDLIVAMMMDVSPE